MKIPRTAIASVIEMTLGLGYRRATKYLSETCVVRASRRFKPSKRSRTDEIVLTVGKPNYAEREFIAKCKQAGEPFPVKKVQLREWPKK